jgi:uncharacterized membrane protein YbhN (UPF0104 family)
MTLRRPRVRTVVTSILAGTILVVFAGYLALHAQELWTHLHWDTTALVGVTALSVVIMLLQTVNSRQALAVMDVEYPFRDLFTVQVGATILNYLPMKAGTLLRARVYNNRTGLNYASFAALLLMVSACNATAATLLCAVCLWFLPGATAVAHWATGLVLMALTGGAMLALFVTLPRWNWLPLWPTIRKQLIACRFMIRGRPAVAGRIFAVSLLIAAASTARTCFAFQCVSEPFHLAGAALIGSSSVLLGLLSLACGGLGFREEMFGVINSLVGEGFRAGLLAALVERVVIVGLLLVLGTVALPRTLSHAMPSRPAKDDDLQNANDCPGELPASVRVAA